MEQKNGSGTIATPSSSGRMPSNNYSFPAGSGFISDDAIKAVTIFVPRESLGSQSDVVLAEIAKNTKIVNECLVSINRMEEAIREIKKTQAQNAKRQAKINKVAENVRNYGKKRVQPIFKEFNEVVEMEKKSDEETFARIKALETQVQALWDIVRPSGRQELSEDSDDDDDDEDEGDLGSDASPSPKKMKLSAEATARKNPSEKKELANSEVTKGKGMSIPIPVAVVFGTRRSLLTGMSPLNPASAGGLSPASVGTSVSGAFSSRRSFSFGNNANDNKPKLHKTCEYCGKPYTNMGRFLKHQKKNACKRFEFWTNGLIKFLD